MHPGALHTPVPMNPETALTPVPVHPNTPHTPVPTSSSRVQRDTRRTPVPVHPHPHAPRHFVCPSRCASPFTAHRGPCASRPLCTPVHPGSLALTSLSPHRSSRQTRLRSGRGGAPPGVNGAAPGVAPRACPAPPVKSRLAPGGVTGSSGPGTAAPPLWPARPSPAAVVAAAAVLRTRPVSAWGSRVLPTPSWAPVGSPHPEHCPGVPPPTPSWAPVGFPLPEHRSGHWGVSPFSAPLVPNHQASLWGPLHSRASHQCPFPFQSHFILGTGGVPPS